LAPWEEEGEGEKGEEEGEKGEEGGEEEEKGGEEEAPLQKEEEQHEQLVTYQGNRTVDGRSCTQCCADNCFTNDS
jgi:hypothetical protein